MLDRRNIFRFLSSANISTDMQRIFLSCLRSVPDMANGILERIKYNITFADVIEFFDRINVFQLYILVQIF